MNRRTVSDEGILDLEFDSPADTTLAGGIIARLHGHVTTLAARAPPHTQVIGPVHPFSRFDLECQYHHVARSPICTVKSCDDFDGRN